MLDKNIEKSDIARSEEIKTWYLATGCQSTDVDEAVEILMRDCKSLFKDDRHAWSFIMEEPHEDLEEDDSESKREALADDEFESYNFGEGVTVSQSDNWDKNEADDLVKIVYVTFDDDLPDADSSKISFHVRFNPDGSVDDAYGLDMESGNDVGFRPADRMDDILQARPAE